MSGRSADYWPAISRTPERCIGLAEGLGVSADEFFVDPAQLLYRRFDRATNPLVAEVLESRPELFQNWTEADFDELHSRFGAGGPLTRDGVLESVRRMNRKREIIDKLNLLLETGEAEVLGGIIDLFYEKIGVRKGKK